MPSLQRHPFRCVSEVLSGATCDEAPTLLPRLMRRDPDLRWTGRVHESVSDWVTSGNKRIQEIGASILHLGNAQDIVAAKDKLNRYWTLLKRRCSEEPENPVMWSHLARVSLRANCPGEALEAAQKGGSGDRSPVATTVTLLSHW